MVKKISGLETHELRHKILRNHQPIEEMGYPGDDDESTFHVGGFLDGHLVAIASLYDQSVDGLSGHGQWRLRGVAVDDSAKGQGWGWRLVEASLKYASENKGLSVWCNARVSALGFYEKLEFEKEGPEFDLPNIGPHYIMRKSL